MKFVRGFQIYRRHFDKVSKRNVGLKTLLLQGLSESEFYGDLVYKFRKIIGKNDFLPALNPACSSAIISSAWGLSLFKMTFSMTLLE